MKSVAKISKNDSSPNQNASWINQKFLNYFGYLNCIVILLLLTIGVMIFVAFKIVKLYSNLDMFGQVLDWNNGNIDASELNQKMQKLLEINSYLKSNLDRVLFDIKSELSSLRLEINHFEKVARVDKDVVSENVLKLLSGVDQLAVKVENVFAFDVEKVLYDGVASISKLFDENIMVAIKRN